MTALTQSYYSGASDAQIIYETIGNYLDRVCDQFPDSEALVVRHQNIRWTYQEYKQQIDRLATGLLALGIEPGDRVGIWGAKQFRVGTSTVRHGSDRRDYGVYQSCLSSS